MEDDDPQQQDFGHFISLNRSINHEEGFSMVGYQLHHAESWTPPLSHLEALEPEEKLDALSLLVANHDTRRGSCKRLARIKLSIKLIGGLLLQKRRPLEIRALLQC